MMFLIASLVISASMGVLALISVESENRTYRSKRLKEAEAVGFAVL